MTEIEQLRKEINELRERIARLEARPVDTGQRPAPMPTWTLPSNPTPPWVVTC